ncbi:hypothetical protein FQN54_003134 [Arachnomyces sp. PD_36]|nr:hypothetical protein FQN54_003134 [Arachnomyces sp. PD_36]
MEDMEAEKLKRKKGEEYLRSSLSSIATLSTEITRRLDYTYYNLLEKLASLQSTVTSFQELSDLTTRLEADFENEASQLDKDSRRQIDELKGTDAHLKRIEALESRMTAGREKVEKLEKRLQVVREKIDGWERREGEWQARVSRRLRILWAVMGTLFIVSLAASIAQRWPSTSPLEPEASTRVEKFTNESLEFLGADKVELPHPKASGQEQSISVDVHGSREREADNVGRSMKDTDGEEPEALPKVEDPLVRVLDEL